ncbi:DUF2705 family protein [Peribacillus simplex]|uniref:DUF2705 family protein n=1 Tax=Peribacillus simplex TaxID=1478 RepID=UPI003CE9C2FB
MKHKYYLLVISLAFSMQSYFLIHNFNERNSNYLHPFFLFVLGVEPITQYTNFLIWFFVFISISFYFSGIISENINGYGKYMLVRNTQKLKWIMGLYYLTTIRLFGLVVLQFTFFILSSFIFTQNLETFPSIIMLVKVVFIYFLTLLFLIFLQMYLELYTSPQVSLLSVNFYVVLSILLAGVIFLHNQGELLLYGLIPNFAMGLRLDVISDENFIISYPIALLILGLVVLLILYFSIRKIEAKDIY